MPYYDDLYIDPIIFNAFRGSTPSELNRLGVNNTSSDAPSAEVQISRTTSLDPISLNRLKYEYSSVSLAGNSSELQSAVSKFNVLSSADNSDYVEFKIGTLENGDDLLARITKDGILLSNGDSASFSGNEVNDLIDRYNLSGFLQINVTSVDQFSYTEGEETLFQQGFNLFDIKFNGVSYAFASAKEASEAYQNLDDQEVKIEVTETIKLQEEEDFSGYSDIGELGKLRYEEVFADQIARLPYEILFRNFSEDYEARNDNITPGLKEGIKFSVDLVV